MFETEIAQYERLRHDYEQKIVAQMGEEAYREYHEVVFSAHSCAIEGNSFTVDDTRELKEKGMGLIPKNKTLFEAFEMLDHFEAYDYVYRHTQIPFDESFVKEVNRLVCHHTLSYRHPGAVAGAYTTVDMAAGDTVFGDHRQLVARVPKLLESTTEAMHQDIHPMVVAARFHGFFIYLHPFLDGNGRTARLLTANLLLRMGHPMVVIPRERREEYIAALRMIRREGTDEALITFFLKVASERMEQELKQKDQNTKRFLTFVF